MPLALIAHAPTTATPSDRLHLWVGVTGNGTRPTLAWRVDGRLVIPEPVDAKRPGLHPVLEGVLATRAAVTVYRGDFAITGLSPGKPVRIELTSGTESVVRILRPLPASIPSEPQERFTILLASCFHQHEDQTGKAGHVVSHLPVHPDLSIFAGDQVYLDLPTGQNFEDDESWLANKFQNDYMTNWFGDTTGVPPEEIPAGFPQMLGLAPAMFLPDDHEFWNNYPFWSVQIGNSITENGRARWTRAAEATYRGFQQPAVLAFGTARTLVVEPLSILMLDTRGQRSTQSRKNDGDLLGKAGRDALEAWVDDLVDRAGKALPRYPMLVTGQSLFRPAAGTISGKFADYEFPDYECDYAFMVAQIERLSNAGLPLLLATGDVHWGRLSQATDPTAVGASVFEIISSPMSLVSTIGVDRAKEAWGAIGSFFGGKDRWPRHSDAQKPPPRFGSAGQYHAAVCDLPNRRPATMRGNQIVMLRFVQAGGGLDVDVNCHPLLDDIDFDTKEQWSTTLRLRPPRNR